LIKNAPGASADAGWLLAHFSVAVWINRYRKYWQEQFDMLAVALQEIEDHRPRKRKARKPAL
jgi:hypothetical protein